MEVRFEKYNLWNSVVLALEQGDTSGANELEGRLFADWPYTVRGQRFPARLIGYWHGYLALRRGQSAKSIEHFKEALRHPPIIWMIDPLEDCLANAYLEAGQPDEAIKEYDRILRLNPSYPLAHYHLGQAYERQGQQQQARASYERFLEVWKNADAEVPEIIRGDLNEPAELSESRLVTAQLNVGVSKMNVGDEMIWLSRDGLPVRGQCLLIPPGALVAHPQTVISILLTRC